LIGNEGKVPSMTSLVGFDDTGHLDDPTLHALANVVERPLPLGALPPLNQRIATL